MSEPKRPRLDSSLSALYTGTLASEENPWPFPEERSQQRRRSRAESGRRFECTHPGCGRDYSRAEHLYRHQLNRNVLPCLRQ